MSLVAYDASSDEESNSSDVEEQNIKNQSNLSIETTTSQENIDINGLLFKALPPPKPINELMIKEEDDEFLHKKPIPLSVEKKPKAPVRITVPKLSDFKDVDESNKKINSNQNNSKQKFCGLLNILPKPKEETLNSVPSSTESSLTKSSSSSKTQINKFIPDSVKNKPNVATIKGQNDVQKVKENINNITNSHENDDEDDDSEDYFSLNSKMNLPKVSINEINAMVAKKAAEMAENSCKLNESLNNPTLSLNSDINEMETDVQLLPTNTNQNEQVKVDEKALHILVGSRAKRRKVEEVNIVDLSSAEVLPNKDEWLRTALATSTTYQPKGVLLDEEPAPGTRRKHQITYLAHQAKANEMELQAMWSANRHTRRQTQSKYGF